LPPEAFARRVFRWAAIYGFIVLPPMYLLAPDDEHLPAYLGFVGLALVFQAVFWIIGGDPVKYRALMLPSVAEKAVFAVPALVLYAMAETDAVSAFFAAVDIALGIGFLIAWRRTRLTA
jgi:hypothetical protein